MWDPEADDDYRVRWWLAMLGIPWLRALIFIGFGASFFSLVFLPPTHRDGTQQSLGERAIQLALLAIVAILVLRIEQRRQRERAMRIAEDADAAVPALEDDGERPPGASPSPEPRARAQRTGSR